VAPPKAAPPIAKRVTAQAVRPKAAAPAPGRSGDRRAKDPQVAALPGRNDSFTPPSYGVGGGVNRPPTYPRQARRMGWEGRVLLRVRVDDRGRVDTVRLGRSSGHGLLDRAALDAVRRWRFAPATRGATPVAAWIDVPIRFRLTDGS
jgi:protein TonB